MSEDRDGSRHQLMVRPSYDKPGEHRAECSRLSPKNPYGLPKLVATIEAEGIWIWCQRCKERHLLSREQCMQAWQRGESATAQCARQEEQVG